MRLNISKKCKRKDHICDYQDLLNDMLNLSRDHTCLEKISQEIRYLFVDEYQDVDVIQAEILENLANPNLKNPIHFIRVGDVNQSIYGFRGASGAMFDSPTVSEYRPKDNASILQKKEVKANKANNKEIKVTLQVNMRSQPNILNFINWLFSKNQEGHDTIISEKMKNYVPLHPKPAEFLPLENTGVFILRHTQSSNTSEEKPGTQTAYTLRYAEAKSIAKKISGYPTRKP